jgi:colicin import membrane protein
MSAQSPGAYGLSALLHGSVVALILFFSYASRGLVRDTPKVFELVAGAGDNYAATAAPALGSPGGVKVQQAPAPRAPAPQAPPTPKAPKAEAPPIQSAPEAPAKQAKPIDLVAQLKRVEMRRELNLERKYEKEKEAEEKRQAAAAKVAHIDAEGIREGVLGGSTENKTGGAGGKALTREEGSLLDAYFAMLKARIKENHVPPEGVSEKLSARVEFFVAADGSVSRVRIVGPSGNSDFDRSVIEAVEHTRAVGPRPDGRSESVTMTIKMSDDESP